MKRFSAKAGPIAILAGFVVLLALAAWVAPAAATAEDLDGKALYTETHKCNMCHAVPAAEIEAKTKSESMVGPELGGAVEVELEKLAAYLRKEMDLDGNSHKKPFKGTDEELQAIVDWLGSLEAPK